MNRAAAAAVAQAPAVGLALGESSENSSAWNIMQAMNEFRQENCFIDIQVEVSEAFMK